jgi:peptidoglycan hydrolase-like protein with peptidoglycan-binding domain
MHSGSFGERRLVSTVSSRLANRSALCLVSRQVPRLLLVCALFFFAGLCRAFADEQVRQVQEELRKRHVYFGDIDGRVNPELLNAVQRYQARKGFAVTGRVDRDTALSLGVATTLPVAATNPPLPDAPILKSDFSRELTPEQRRQLEEQPDATADATTNAPAPPAESPAPADSISPQRLTKLVEDYLRDGESNDASAQLKYYAFPVDYFHDGPQHAAYVQRDSDRQAKLWPVRKFVLAGPVQFNSLGSPGEIAVEFNYVFEERGNKGAAIGNARQRWNVRTQGDELKITKIDERILPRQ